jgi:two-component system, OmpR family, phosphate regulon sensor histidine kinase PhoR
LRAFMKLPDGAIWRQRQAPLLAWVAAASAVIAALVALALQPWAALFMAAAAAACIWAARQTSALVIAGNEEVERLVSPGQLAPLLEALPDAVLLIDAAGRLVGSNAAARAQLQFEAKGQYLTTILRHPDVLEAVERTIAEGAGRVVEYDASTQTDRHVRCYVAPLEWVGRRAALLVFHDETARVSTERLRADFLANASHELRTPLASLTLLIETLAGHAREEAVDRDRFLKMMQVQAERMRRLIDDLLSLSRIELDEHVPPTDRADLAAVVSEVVDTLRAVAAERDVRLAWTPPPQPLKVVGERFQLSQVVQNLIDNAVKYTAPGGEVRIEAGFAGDRDQAIQRAGRQWPEAGRMALLSPMAVANRGYAFVRVEDSGPGIAPRYLPRLGGRFFRVERETGQERGGTGLGLAIVKHIVNRHGGGLLVESIPGRGSAFAAYVESAEEG